MLPAPLPVRCNLRPPPAFPQHRCEPCLEKSVRWRGRGRGARGTRNEGRGTRDEGIRERMPTLLSFAVEGRATGLGVARITACRAEDRPSRSAHWSPCEISFSPLRQSKVAGLQIPKTPENPGVLSLSATLEAGLGITRWKVPVWSLTAIVGVTTELMRCHSVGRMSHRRLRP
jgi:hypothetical protein